MPVPARLNLAGTTHELCRHVWTPGSRTPTTKSLRCRLPIRLRTLSETFQHPCHVGTFGESARDVDLALTLALTETLTLSDLIRPTGSPPKLTPVLLAPPSMQGVRS